MLGETMRPLQTTKQITVTRLNLLLLSLFQRHPQLFADLRSLVVGIFFIGEKPRGFAVY